MNRIRYLMPLLIVLILLVMNCKKQPNKRQISKPTDYYTPQSQNKTIIQENRRIGLVLKAVNDPFYAEIERGVRKAEADYGIHLLEKISVDLDSSEEQIKMIEELITQRVNVIIITPNSPVDLIPVLKKAQNSGIKIVNLDYKIDRNLAAKAGLKGYSYIGVDNFEGAYQAVKYLCQQIRRPVLAAIIDGNRNDISAVDRRNGAIKAFDENKNIKIVAVETANWSEEEAISVTEELFFKYPLLRILFCANDKMALGALRFIDKNYKKNLMIAAFGGFIEIREAVINGKLIVSADPQAELQGYLSVKYAVNLCIGEKVPEDTLVDIKLITKGL